MQTPKHWQVLRKGFLRACLLVAPRRVPIGSVEQRRIAVPDDEIDLRIYTPAAASSITLPALVYFHGGGFVLGGLAAYDPLCRALCNACGCRVIAAGYRLAPEHKFPAALDDARAALAWTAAHAAEIGIDADRLAVGGDSCGGNLAAGLALLAREGAGPRLAFQLLAYPMTTMQSRAPEHRLPLAGRLIDRLTIDVVRNNYVPDGTDSHDCRLAPGEAHDLAGLPPAYIIAAGLDPLHRFVLDYAEKLRRAGNSVTLDRHPWMPHGFLNLFGILAESRRALDNAGDAIKAALCLTGGVPRPVPRNV